MFYLENIIVIDKKINYSAPGSQMFADLQPHFPRFVCILHTNLGKCDNGLGMARRYWKIPSKSWGVGQYPPRCPEAKPTDEGGIALPRRMRRVFSNTAEPYLCHCHCNMKKNKHSPDEWYWRNGIGMARRYWKISSESWEVEAISLMSGGEADGRGGIASTSKDEEDIFPIPPSHAYAISIVIWEK